MKNKRILSLVLAFAMLLGTFSFAFADEAVAQTENEKVLKLVELGLVEGDAGTGNLRLDDPIKRAEVAKMVVVAMDKKDVADSVAGVKTFPDVLNAPSEKWANGYINVAYSEGIVNGYPDGTFRPGNDITKAEVVKMMVMVLGGLTEEEQKLAVGPNWATIYLAKAKDLEILEGIDLGNADEAAKREEVFELVFNTLTSKHGDLLIANTVEGIVVENYRTERLASDEITVHVMKDQVQREGKYYEKDDEFNITITPELRKKGLDVETLLGQVVSVSFDKEGKVVSVEPIKGYTYVQGEIDEIREKEIKVDGRWYTIGKDEGRTTTVDERLYQVYFNNEDLHYYDNRDFDKDDKVVKDPRSFVGKALVDEAPEYVRLTVRNGKVLFIDAYQFIDIAPVAKDIDKNVVKYYDDSKDGQIEELLVRDSAYVIAFEDDEMKLGSNDMIKEGDVIHWYYDARSTLTVFVRPFDDNKVEGTYKEAAASRAKDAGVIMITVDGKDYPALIASEDSRNPVYSKLASGQEFYELTGDYDVELADFEKEEVTVLLDMFGFVQSISSEIIDGSFYAIVSDTSRSKGEVRLVNKENENNWYGTDRDTTFKGVDGRTKDAKFDKFDKYDLVLATAKEDVLVYLEQIKEGGSGDPIIKLNRDLIEFEDDYYYIGKRTILFVEDQPYTPSSMTVADFIKNYDQKESIKGYVIEGNSKIADVIVITKATPKYKFDTAIAKVTKVIMGRTNKPYAIKVVFSGSNEEKTFNIAGKDNVALLTGKKVVEGSIVELTHFDFDGWEDDADSIAGLEEILDENAEEIFEIVRADRGVARNEYYVSLADKNYDAKKSFDWNEDNGYVRTYWLSKTADIFGDYRIGSFVAIEKEDKYETISILDVRTYKYGRRIIAADGEWVEGPPATTAGVVTYIDVPVEAGTDVVAKVTLPADNTDVYKVVAYKSDGTAANAGVTTLISRDVTATDLGIVTPGEVNATYVVRTYKVVGTNDVELSNKVVKNVDVTAPILNTTNNLTDNKVEKTATYDVNADGAGANITVTAVEAGLAGDGYKLALVDPSGNDQELSVVFNGVDTVTVNLATGNAGAITSTLKDVVDAVNANTFANQVVELSVDAADEAKTAVAVAADATGTAGGQDAVDAKFDLTFDSAMKADTTATVTIDGVEYNATVAWAGNVATLTITADQFAADDTLSGKTIEAISLTDAAGNAADISANNTL